MTQNTGIINYMGSSVPRQDQTRSQVPLWVVTPLGKDGCREAVLLGGVPHLGGGRVHGQPGLRGNLLIKLALLDTAPSKY